MRFSADTDRLDSPPPAESPPVDSVRGLPTKLSLIRQPHYLVADVLLEIMGWLAFIDWVACSDHLRYSKEINRCTCGLHLQPGYSLIRATHVCRYWRFVALENRSLWCYIPLSETFSRNYGRVDREFTCRVQRSVGLAKVSNSLIIPVSN